MNAGGLSYMGKYRGGGSERTVRGAIRTMLVVFMAACLTCFGAGAFGQAEPNDPPSDPRFVQGTAIRSGFELAILVAGEKGLSGLQVVEANGNVHFGFKDMIGNVVVTVAVSVKDKTVEEARVAIIGALSAYIKAPVVRVIVTHLPHLRVEVRGAASKNGPLDLPLEAKLSDALAASGIGPTADLANIMVLRRINELPSAKGGPAASPSVRSLHVDMEAFMRGESDDDPPLASNDIIRIPERAAPRPELQIVRVIGEVEREAFVPYRVGMKAADALAAVGGLKETADRTKIRLVRAADGKVLDLDADRIASNAPTDNPPVAAGDLIIVGVRDRSRQFVVLGEVVHQGAFACGILEKMTVLRAVAMAGGPLKGADGHKALLRKRYLLNPATARDIPFDLDKILARKQPDLGVEAGDAVVIPHRQRRPNLLLQLAPLLLHFVPL